MPPNACKIAYCTAFVEYELLQKANAPTISVNISQVYLDRIANRRTNKKQAPEAMVETLVRFVR